MFNQTDVIACIIFVVIVLCVFLWATLRMSKKGDEDIEKSWQENLQERGKWTDEQWEKDEKAREWSKRMLEKMKKDKDRYIE